MAVAVAVGYLLTLAPTVTLWDAGELVTAARTLGIPHPPGTPLFVVIGHVWGALVPLGDYAWRLNALSALLTAAGAGLYFLCVDRVLAGATPLVRRGGAVAAAFVGAFTFTTWQNANEAEVYGITTCSIAGACWLALRWRDARGTPRAEHYLLVVAYLLALSIGNHLLGLLAGPALAVFVWHALRTAPAPVQEERRAETAMLVTLVALWVTLCGVGFGKVPLLALGGAGLVAALVLGLVARAPLFPIAATLAAAVGVSTYAYLLVRSGLDPALDMADPETWRALLGVIRREQYPPRSPLDNPLFPSGPSNPGRTPALMWQQLVNYFQYFDWQWARGLGVARIAMTALFAALGIAGWRELYARDRSAAWLLGALWLITGLGLMGYMNFKPGYSLFWDRYPASDQHEVRERDYFFIVSFQTWGLLAGVGLAAAAQHAARRGPRVAGAVLAVAFLPLIMNWTSASRRGDDAYLARDFAYDLLQSVGPYGILFVLGDNDTYPLWYAQHVAGVRRDVSVVNLSLANTDWYLRQLRRPPAEFDAGGAPWYTPPPGLTPEPPLDLPDEMMARLVPQRLDRDAAVRAGTLVIPVRSGEVLWPRDQAVLLILQRHLGRRPIAFAISSGRSAWRSLERTLVQRGLVFEVFDGRPDTVAAFPPGLQGLPLDTARTRFLVDSVYRYGGLLERPPARLEPAARQVASTLSQPQLELAQQHARARDVAGTLLYLQRAARLAPAPELDAIVRDVAARGLEALGVQPDSP